MPRYTFAGQLDRARLILSVAQANADLGRHLAQLGYDADALKEGWALYTACTSAQTATHGARGARQAATRAVERLREQVEAQCSTLRQIVRAAFAGQVDVYERLGLRGGLRAVDGAEDAPVEQQPARQRSAAKADFLDRAHLLYDGALGDKALGAALTKLGYPAERLARERADVAALEAADVAHNQRRAAAKARTAEQRRARAALQQWLTRFGGIVAPALRDRPDLLLKLGVKARGRVGAGTAGTAEPLNR
jgi:hypothetical protein